MRRTPLWKFLACGCLTSVCASGCFTITPTRNPLSFMNGQKSQIAAGHYEATVDVEPDKPIDRERVKLAYARMMEDSGHVEESLMQYSQVLEAEPKNTEALLGVARCEQLMGNFEGAQTHLQQAAKLAPQSATVQFAQGQLSAARQDWTSAAQAYAKALEAEPNSQQFRYALAVAYTHTGRLDEAMPHFIRTVGEAEAHYNAGVILYEEGRLSESERELRMALARKPDMRDAQRWLAHLDPASQTRHAAASADVAQLEPEVGGSSSIPDAPTISPAVSLGRAEPAPVIHAAEQQTEAASARQRYAVQQAEQLRNQTDADFASPRRN